MITYEMTYPLATQMSDLDKKRMIKSLSKELKKTNKKNHKTDPYLIKYMKRAQLQNLKK